MCSKLRSKFFPHTNTSNPHNNPLRKVLLFIPFYRQDKSNLPTQGHKTGKWQS